MADFLKHSIFRQQSENKINFESFTNFSFYWFRLVMFDFTHSDSNFVLKEKIIHIARLIYVKFALLCILLSISSFSAYTVAHSDDFLIASKSVPNFVTMALIGVKAFATFLKKDHIWNILQELEAKFNQRVSVQKDFKMKKYLDDYHFCVRIYAVTFLLTLIPIVFPAIPFILFGTVKNPVTYWYPFNIFRPGVFPLILIWTDYVAWIAAFYLLGCDSMLYAFITLISMEFNVIKTDLTNLCSAAKTERLTTTYKLVDRHNDLLELCDKLQEIYGITFLFNFFISSLILCFIGFHLSINSDNAFFVPLLGLLVGQIFLLCMFGQKLIDSNESLADGVYNSGWEDFDDISLKKQLILIIMRARRPKRLTAMKFADISLPSLTTVNDFESFS